MEPTEARKSGRSRGYSGFKEENKVPDRCVRQTAWTAIQEGGGLCQLNSLPPEKKSHAGLETKKKERAVGMSVRAGD